MYLCLGGRVAVPCMRREEGGGISTAGLPQGGRRNVRVLVNEARGIVDLVVDDHVKIILGVVLGDVRVGEFLGAGHLCGFWGL